jgi:hypothetical protein
MAIMKAITVKVSFIIPTELNMENVQNPNNTQNDFQLSVE